MAVIKAQVPLAEIAQYGNAISSVTGGQGSYHLEFSHYELVPGNVQTQIVEKYNKERAAGTSSG
ncbi:MAG: hypothetical protein IH795_12475 [Bacteroidetes bacterium]|nr:hypothetical protein [Bacteroidota bacterium]